MEKATPEMIEKVDMGKYEKNFSEDGLWDKIRKHASSIGITLIYKALQLFYLAKSDHCPPKVKAGIIAALGYLISPIDLIADVIPVVGFSDDALAIGAALVMAQAYIDDDIREQAKKAIENIFGHEARIKIEVDEGNIVDV